ENKWNRVYLYL
ncbi:hypothetical protein VCHC17A1_4092B, partial [Vibrio cholerae HC-17A1]